MAKITLEQVDKAMNIARDAAPDTVIAQLQDLRNSVRCMPYSVSEYDATVILNKYATVAGNSWADKALEVFVGPRPTYDPSRDN